MYKVFENDNGAVGQIAQFPPTAEGRDDAIDHAKWYEADNLIPAFVMDTNNPDDPVVWGDMRKTTCS
jgi:hypothetical protein